MIYLLCRNRVKDFSKWKDVFDTNKKDAGNAGLRLINMWRSTEDPNNVFFMFEVKSAEKALEFMSTPEAAEAGKTSGVVEGEYHFLEEA